MVFNLVWFCPFHFHFSFAFVFCFCSRCETVMSVFLICLTCLMMGVCSFCCGSLCSRYFRFFFHFSKRGKHKMEIKMMVLSPFKMTFLLQNMCLNLSKCCSELYKKDLIFVGDFCCCCRLELWLFFIRHLDWGKWIIYDSSEFERKVSNGGPVYFWRVFLTIRLQILKKIWLILSASNILLS